MNIFIDKYLSNELKLKKDEFSPLLLAYIGDAYFELYVRTKLLCFGNMQVDKIHKAATNFVRAKAQSDILEKIYEHLTDEEITIYKRGRNAKSCVPKNADMNQYRRATGFEALIGYLYINESFERLNFLLEKVEIKV